MKKKRKATRSRKPKSYEVCLYTVTEKKVVKVKANNDVDARVKGLESLLDKTAKTVQLDTKIIAIIFER